ncbi:hypothetical protein Aperf_G00000116231 [Anoplocephala perfoliata]
MNPLNQLSAGEFRRNWDQMRIRDLVTYCDANHEWHYLLESNTATGIIGRQTWVNVELTSLILNEQSQMTAQHMEMSLRYWADCDRYSRDDMGVMFWLSTAQVIGAGNGFWTRGSSSWRLLDWFNLFNDEARNVSGFLNAKYYHSAESRKYESSASVESLIEFIRRWRMVIYCVEAEDITFECLQFIVRNMSEKQILVISTYQMEGHGDAMNAVGRLLNDIGGANGEILGNCEARWFIWCMKLDAKCRALNHYEMAQFPLQRETANAVAEQLM